MIPFNRKCSEEANPWKQKIDQGLPVAGRRGEEVGNECQWVQGFLLGGENVLKLDRGNNYITL